MRGLTPFNKAKKQRLAEEEEGKPVREEGRMWVCIRPQGGQDYYLLMCEIRRSPGFCPIHRFDGMDHVPLY